MTAVLGARSPDESTADRPASLGGRGYRPHLDGLRAVAVYLVVAFHAGVDSLRRRVHRRRRLLRPLGLPRHPAPDPRPGRPRGDPCFGRFYARRMRRLLPASVVLLLVTAVVYSAIASPAEFASAIGSFKAAFLYVANWYFIHQSSDYFAHDINTSPVVHFWSLAVEEQFYFVWPLLLGALFVAHPPAPAQRPAGHARCGGRRPASPPCCGRCTSRHERQPRLLRHGRPGVPAARRRPPRAEPGSVRRGSACAGLRSSPPLALVALSCWPRRPSTSP